MYPTVISDKSDLKAVSIVKYEDSHQIENSIHQKDMRFENVNTCNNICSDTCIANFDLTTRRN